MVEVRVGHSFILILLDLAIGHTMLQIMGLICPLGTFCPLGHFVPGTFCPLGRFVPWDVLSLGRFFPGTFYLRSFCMCIAQTTDVLYSVHRCICSIHDGSILMLKLRLFVGTVYRPYNVYYSIVQYACIGPTVGIQQVKGQIHVGEDKLSVSN